MTAAREVGDPTINGYFRPRIFLCIAGPSARPRCGGKNAAAQSVISASKAASDTVSLQGTITNTGGQINTMQQSTLAAIQKALAAGQASVTTVRGAAAPVAVITTPAGPGTPITYWPTPSVGTNTVVIGTLRVLSPAEAAANAQTILNAEPVQALMQQGIVAPLNNQPSSQGIVSGAHNQCTQQDYGTGRTDAVHQAQTARMTGVLRGTKKRPRWQTSEA